MTEVETTAVVASVPTIIALVAHYAAAFGKPKIVQKLGVLSMIFDVLAGNYGKAKNRGTSSDGSAL